MMKIAFILWSGMIAGAEKHVLEFIRYLKKEEKEISITVLFLHKAFEMQELLDEEKVPYYEIGFKNGFDIFAGCNFTYNIIKRKYDIVHVHIATPSIGFWLRLCKRSRLIYTEHTSLLRKSKIKKCLYKSFVMSCDKVIFVTKNQMDSLMKYYGVYPKKREVICPGIDIEKYNTEYDIDICRKNLGLSKDLFIVGYVGRFKKFKNIDMLIEAINIAKENISNIMLLIIGYGEEEEYLKRTVMRENVSDFVKMYIKPHNLIELQQAMDVLVHPSERESFGLSVVESMALGKIVIVNNFESAEEIIDNGRNGIIIPEISKEKIAEELINIYKNSKNYNNLKESAVKKIKDNFSKDDSFSKLKECYYQLIG